MPPTQESARSVGGSAAVGVSVDRYYDPSTDQFLSVDPLVAETGQPYAFTGDDPLNATDPLGLYNCSGKSSSYVVAKYKRGGSTYYLRCGQRAGKGQNGSGVRHIQEDKTERGTNHFGGDLSHLTISYLIKLTISRGTPEAPENQRGPTVAYDRTFTVNGSGLPEPEQFTMRVVVNNSTGNVTTAYSPDDVVDDNPLNDCSFAGADACGLGPGSFSNP